MTYPFERHTADLARFANTWGLTLSPDGSGMVWSANSSSLDKYEAWNNTTRTLIASGVLDLGYATFLGSTPGFGMALVDDGTLYQTATVSGGVPATTHLTSWSGHGAGSQTNRGGTPQMAGVLALKAGDGKTYICCPSASFYLDGYVFCHETPGTPPVHLDTLAVTGKAWQIKDYVLDDLGRIWACGGGNGTHGDLAADEMAFWCVVGGTNQFFTITLPAAVSGTVFEAQAAFAAGHFLVNTQQSAMLTVETDGTISHTVTGPIGDSSYDIPVQMHRIRSGDRTFWVENTEYSTTDLSTVRTLPFSLWGSTIDTHVQQGCFFDRFNHALFVGLDNTNQDFAWLFLPRRTVRTDVRIGLTQDQRRPINLTRPTITEDGDTLIGSLGDWIT